MFKKTKTLSVTAFIKQAETIKKQIAAKRDELRDLVSDYEEIIDCCERADEGLECAIDALSEQL